MAHSAVPRDTHPAVFDLQVARCAAMTSAERVAVIEQLDRDLESLGIAGILAERPHLSEVEIRHELACRRYGRRLGDDAYRNLLG